MTPDTVLPQQLIWNWKASRGEALCDEMSNESMRSWNNIETHLLHPVLYCSIIDWNNPLIINKMYKVYLGDIPLKTKVSTCITHGRSNIFITFIFSEVCFLFFTQGATMKQELKHEPVSTRVKMKILPHLLRSRLAAECFPANIQVKRDSVWQRKWISKELVQRMSW